MLLTRKQLLSLGAATLFILFILYLSSRGNRQDTSNSFQRQGDTKQFLDWGLCEKAPSQGVWHNEPPPRCGKVGSDVATCGHGEHKVWRWQKDALACNVRRVKLADVKGLLRNQWFAVVGDSIGRNLFAAFVRLVADEGNYPVVKGHQDFEYDLPGSIKASFIWAPYSGNATAQLNDWVASGSSPDVVLLSLGLWHMLHVTSAESFSDDVAALQPAVEAFAAHKLASVVDRGAKHQPYRLDICSISALHTSKMKTAEKRENMTPDNVKAYNEVIRNSRTLLPDGPMHLQDIHNITLGKALPTD